ncbi:hypothetical protein FBY33_2101 [Arthrobacter sp. SLBN-112]|uniref:hypothetical protein n=1 Tax=Arthrobacter sp. SLBN-112 TaxID=2768452 RepID=UPI0011538259|nr:hypothetical protein [Arthrobacter sp. SLBN-112]TQJ40055.1 hypothetical protein FBY33_2101 [Arthrobacter sp. SLBN-112]
MATALGTIHPLIFSVGNELTLTVTNLPPSASDIVAEVYALDAVEERWMGSYPLVMHADGTARGTFPMGTILAETLIYVGAVQHSGKREVLEQVEISIVNPEHPIPTSHAEVEARYDEVTEKIRRRYEVSLGDSEAPSVKEHKIVHLVEGLLITDEMKLPGVRIYGTKNRPGGLDARNLMHETLDALGWPDTAPEDVWTQRFAHDHPVAVVVCPSVYAADVEEADAISSRARDDLLSVMAINRGARGRPTVTWIAQRQSDGTVTTKFRFDHPGYRGNLAGGFVAGENQANLLSQHAAVQNDPVLKLCVDLFGEAVAEQSKDARYFRLWSAMETLAIARVAPDQVVTLLDGSVWPHGQRTDRAAPRVYQLIVDRLFSAPDHYNEESMVQPASSLYELVRAWYARRNATAHYGRFLPLDEIQRTKPWYIDAHLTVPPQRQPFDSWMSEVQHLAERVLQTELIRVGNRYIQ